MIGVPFQMRDRHRRNRSVNGDASSIRAPILIIGSAKSLTNVASAILASTSSNLLPMSLPSLSLPLSRHGSVAPDWGTEIALGHGGLIGSYTGARIQPRLPDAAGSAVGPKSDVRRSRLWPAPMPTTL